MANSTAAPPLILAKIWAKRCRTGMALLVSAGLLFAAGWLASAPAYAQPSPQAQMRFPDRPKPVPPTPAAQAAGGPEARQPHGIFMPGRATHRPLNSRTPP